MEIANIIKLIETVSASNLTEFSYKEGSTKLTFSKNQGRVVMTPGVVEGSISAPVAPVASVQPAATVAAPVEQAPAQEEAAVVNGNEVKSPLVGTFYSAPSPDAPAFVKVGDTVKKGQTLGIVEAMKLMNEIESDYDGVVQAILVDNEEVVEYGQPLFVIG